MQQRWKQVLCSLLGVLLLAGSLLTVPAAAAETTAPQTTAAESTDDAKDSGNTRQIVQTLVIFTVACGVTAFSQAAGGLVLTEAYENNKAGQPPLTCLVVVLVIFSFLPEYAIFGVRHYLAFTMTS